MSSNKRTSTFVPGSRDGYGDERPEDPADAPKRATAAQLAKRNIKTAKAPRRPAGASSGLGAFANPNPTPPSSDFNFSTNNTNPTSTGASGSTSTNAFGGFAQSQPQPQSGGLFSLSQQQNPPAGNLFGGSSTNSFPPARPSTPSNPFANPSQSFPSTFGGTSTGTFNVQPDLNFGNTATSFSASPAANGARFNFQTPSQQPTTAAQNSNTQAPDDFSFLGAASKKPATPSASGGLFSNTNSNAAPATSGGLFSTNATPQKNTFGGFGSNTGSVVPDSPFGKNPFGTAALNTTSTPFGASTQAAPAAQEGTSTPPTSFGSIASAPQANSGSEAPATPFGTSAATNGAFSLFGTKTPGNLNGSNATSQVGGASTSTPTSSTSLFGNVTAQPTTSASSNSPFGNFGNANAQPTTSASSNSPFGNFGNSNAQPTSSAPSNIFSGFPATTQHETPSTPASVDMLSQSQPSTMTNPLDDLIAQARNQSPNVSKMFDPATIFSSAPRVNRDGPLPRLRGAEGVVNTGSLTNPPKRQRPYETPTEKLNKGNNPSLPDEQTKTTTAPTEASTNDTSPTVAPDPNVETIRTEQSVNAPLAQTLSDSQPPNVVQQDSSTNKADASPSIPASADEPEQPSVKSSLDANLFRASTSAPSTSTPSVTAPAATTSEASDNLPVPTITRVTVPADWRLPTLAEHDLEGLLQQLANLNEIYRSKMAQLPTTALWSALSKWHARESEALEKKIRTAKKLKAAAKGITGDESILSTKRKNESARQESPTKKARSGAAPSTPARDTSTFASTTPKVAPPSNTSTLFGSVTSTAAKNNDSEASTAAPQAGFKSGFGTPAPGSSGFNFSLPPNLGASASASTNGVKSGGFLGQFGGKTGEQLREERIQKALEDFESPTTSDEEGETKAELENRLRREASQRDSDAIAAASTVDFAPSAPAEKAPTPSLKFTGPSSDAPSTSEGITASQGLASGISTPALFSSRFGSPAPSNDGARSVLDTPEAAQSPIANPFSHLASGVSPQHQDDSDDEADEPPAAGESKKRKLDDASDTESESSETLEETMRRKKPATKAPSLASRMTRSNSEAEPDASDKEVTRPSFSSQFFNPVNGSQTPKPPKRPPFDFAAAIAKSAPPKQATHASDQTYKPGNAILFGSTKSANAPVTVTPPTPTPSSVEPLATAAKPAAGPFTFLSAAQSPSTSAISSRAVTPETEASGQDSAVENEEAASTYVERDNSILTAEERDEWDVLFEAEHALAKKVVEQEWKPIAKGRLWLLKNKQTERVVVRLRMKSGQLPINHQILRIIPSSIAGAGKSMVRIKAPTTKGDVEDLFISFNAPEKNEKQELAARFSNVYNNNVPA